MRSDRKNPSRTRGGRKGLFDPSGKREYPYRESGHYSLVERQGGTGSSKRRQRRDRPALVELQHQTRGSAHDHTGEKRPQPRSRGETLAGC